MTLEPWRVLDIAYCTWTFAIASQEEFFNISSTAPQTNPRPVTSDTGQLKN